MNLVPAILLFLLVFVSTVERAQGFRRRAGDGVTMKPLFIAKDRGYFQKEGLKSISC